MSDFPILSAEVTRSLTSLWTRYAGKAPTNGHTEIRGNVVTCVLADAVGDFNKSMIAPQTLDTVRGAGKLTPAAYKREAVAAVVRVTRQRVASFVSSHDRDTDVATEVFTLEPLYRGAPHCREAIPTCITRPYWEADLIPSPVVLPPVPRTVETEFLGLAAIPWSRSGSDVRVVGATGFEPATARPPAGERLE